EITGGTLNVDVNVANSDATHSGLIKVDSGATLVLESETVNTPNGPATVAGKIDGGTVTIIATLPLEGGVSLENGTLDNSGHVNVTGTGNSLDAETIVNSGTIEVLANGVLIIDQVSTVNNTNGHVTVDSTGKLALSSATITSGTVTNGRESCRDGAGEPK